MPYYLNSSVQVHVFDRQVWKRSMPGSEFMAIKSSATLMVSPQALYEVLTPGDIDIVRQVGFLSLDFIQHPLVLSRSCFTRKAVLLMK